MLKKTIALFRRVLAEVEKAKAAGATPEATVKSLAAASPSPELSSFLEIFVRRAFKELNGDLGDLPDGLPDRQACLISYGWGAGCDRKPPLIAISKSG